MLYDISNSAAIDKVTPKLDTGDYFLLDVSKPPILQMEDRSKNYMRIEKGEVVFNNENKPLVDFFKSVDEFTKIVTKDANKTLDSRGKAVWSNNIAYLRIKNKRYMLESDNPKKIISFDYIQKELIDFFLSEEGYMRRICGDKNPVYKSSKTMTAEEAFEKYSPAEYNYLFSEQRKQIFAVILEYLANYLKDIRDYILEHFNSPSAKEDWITIAFDYSHVLNNVMPFDEFAKKEYSLYILLKKFVSNNFNMISKEDDSILGIPNFEFTVNNAKKGFFNNTLSQKAPILLSEEETLKRLKTFDLMSSFSGGFYTIKPDGTITKDLSNGIQFRYQGEVTFLENNPVIEDTFFNLLLGSHELLHFLNPVDITSKNEFLSFFLKNIYDIYLKKDTRIDLIEIKDSVLEERLKPLDKTQFLHDADILIEYFKYNNRKAMSKYLVKNMHRAIVSIARKACLDASKNGNTDTLYQLSRALNLYMALKQKFTLGGFDMKTLLEKDLENRKSNTPPEIKSREELFYYGGQLMYFITNQKKSQNKNYNLIYDAVQLTRTKNMKISIERAFRAYSQTFKMMPEDHNFFRHVLSQVLNFPSGNEKITDEERSIFLLGVTVDNMFFTKKVSKDKAE